MLAQGDSYPFYLHLAVSQYHYSGCTRAACFLTFLFLLIFSMFFLVCPKSEIEFPEQNFHVLLESFALILVTAAPDREQMSLCALCIIISLTQCLGY